MKVQTNIIITDDKEGFRKLVRENLGEFNIHTLAEAINGKHLLEQLQHLTPDIILLDLEMPVMNGNKTMEHLRERYPEAKVIILSMHADFELIENYAKRGAWAYITKDEIMADFEQFARIIEKIKNGKKHIMKSHEEKTKKLSERQREIVQLHGELVSRKEISAQLGITPDALAKQEKKIMAKIGVAGILALANYIAKAGFVFLSGPKNPKR